MIGLDNLRWKLWIDKIYYVTLIMASSSDNKIKINLNIILFLFIFSTMQNINSLKTNI